MQETYRFTHMLQMGRRVQLFYAPSGVKPITQVHLDRGPHFTVSSERADEIQAAAPRGFKNSAFRIVKEYERTVNLEWT